MKQKYYRKKPAKTYIQWWDEKQEAERLRNERQKWQREHDAKLENFMIFKEEAESFCSSRLRVSEAGDDYLLLADDDGMFEAWTYLAQYEQCVLHLNKHIPHLEIDPRIKSDTDVYSRPI